MNLETTDFLSSLDSSTFEPVREVRITSRMTIGGEKHAVDARDLTIVGWADLYRTAEDARHHVFD